MQQGSLAPKKTAAEDFSPMLLLGYQDPPPTPFSTLTTNMAAAAVKICLLVEILPPPPLLPQTTTVNMYLGNAKLIPLVQTLLDYLSVVTRVWAGHDHAEVEWSAGPIPIDDGFGKEIVLKYKVCPLCSPYFGFNCLMHSSNSWEELCCDLPAAFFADCREKLWVSGVGEEQVKDPDQ